jgi:DNA invertase Pin-like site-specific DNA recombinase
MQPTRAALYVRQSEDILGTGLGVARQLKECSERAEALGWTVAEVYTDNDVSATRSKTRPAYQKLLNDISSGLRDGVIVWDLDRLHRKPIELEHFITLADQHSLALASVGGDVDLSTDNGRLFARIKGAVAASEGERKSERIRAKNRQLAEAGTFSNVTNPFGWRGHELEPAEADLVRNGVDALLKGASLVSVTEDFNRSGLKPPRAKQWSRVTVRQTLMRPRNAGIVLLRGQEVGQAVWSPIVTLEAHRAVCALLDDPDRKTTPGNARTLLLSGLMVCGKCGEKGFTGSTHMRNGHRTLSYRCSHCYGVIIKREVADQAVTQWIVSELSLDANDLWKLANQDSLEQITKLRAELAEIKTDEDALAQSGMSMNLIIQMGKALNTRRQTIEQALERLSQQDAITSLVLDLLPSERLLEGVRAGSMQQAAANKPVVQERFDALDLGRKQTVINALCNITVLQSEGKRDEDSLFRRIAITSANRVE